MAATIDEALDIVPRTSREVVGGHSRQGPLGAEALCARDDPDLVSPWEEGMIMPPHGQATVWGTPVGLDRLREGAGWHQALRQWWTARRDAHRRATLAALTRYWDPRSETFRPPRAEAACDMAAAQTGLWMVTMHEGLS